MALPKKYFKMFPGNLKRAWAKYRADLKARGSAKKKKVSNSGGSQMATRRRRAKRVVRRASSRAATRVRYRTRELKPAQMLVAALIAAGGGLGSTLVVNNTPVVKGLDPKLKSLSQIAAGVLALYMLPIKHKVVKAAGAGAVTAGVFGLVQKLSNMDVLAGESAELTNEEIQALMSAGYLSGPAQMAGPRDMMGVGENPSFMGAGENPSFMGESAFQI